MKGIRLALLAAVSLTALAGPPVQTDDPQPIDYKNYEFYTFASSDGTRVETDTVTPGFELVDVGYSIELFVDFSGTGNAYVLFPDSLTHRIPLEQLEAAHVL